MSYETKDKHFSFKYYAHILKQKPDITVYDRAKFLLEKFGLEPRVVYAEFKNKKKQMSKRQTPKNVVSPLKLTNKQWAELAIALKKENGNSNAKDMDEVVDMVC